MYVYIYTHTYICVCTHILYINLDKYDKGKRTYIYKCVCIKEKVYKCYEGGLKILQKNRKHKLSTGGAN